MHCVSLLAGMHDLGSLQFQVFEGGVQRLRHLGAVVHFELHAVGFGAAKDHEIQFRAVVCGSVISVLAATERQHLLHRKTFP